jgi:lipopolysaccharide transport protein LptA
LCALWLTPALGDRARAESAVEVAQAASDAKPGPKDAEIKGSEIKGSEIKGEGKGRRTAERLGLDLASSDAPLQINADQQILRERPDGGRVSEWSGDVTLIQGDLKLTCQKLQISFASDQAGGAVQKIQAEGKVAILQRDVELQCDRAVYEEANCRAVCERIDACRKQGPLADPALLRQGKDVVRGGKIEFDVCSGDFQVSCGAAGSFLPRSQEKKPDAKKPEVKK